MQFYIKLAGRADHNLQIVIAQPNETREQALCRVGIEGDAKDVLVVVFAQWHRPHKTKTGHWGRVRCVEGNKSTSARAFLIGKPGLFWAKKNPLRGGLEEAKGFEPLMEF